MAIFENKKSEKIFFKDNRVYSKQKDISNKYTEEEKKRIVDDANKYPPVLVALDYSYDIPEYNDRDYAIMANREINRRIELPRSRSCINKTNIIIHTVTEILRSEQQRIGSGTNTSWENQVRIYNFFADELGYSRIMMKTKLIL